jgi:hypothetical protein
MRAIVIGLAALALAPAARAGEGGKLSLTVSEKAGIRRFGYPVYAKLEMPREVTAKDRFRLLAGGKPVAAQFRSLAKAGEKKAVALDFAVSCGPLEKKTYTVAYGPDVEAGPEPKGGMKLEESGGVYTVRSGGMAYVVDPKYELLASVRDGKREYLRAAVEVKEKARPTIKVVRQRPLAVCLRCEGPEPGGEEKAQGVRVVELTFPRSKSWVECAVTLDGPKTTTGLIRIYVPLLIEGKTTLVDFGAGSGVYTTLKKGQQAVLKSRFKGKHTWGVYSGDPKTMSPFVLPAPGSTAPAEGWAHVMDSERATAVAVDGFGSGADDAIQVTGPGDLQLLRLFPTAKGRKTYRFWLHFVKMPVQLGAMTSPQSMQAPLAVEVKPAK